MFVRRRERVKLRVQVQLCSPDLFQIKRLNPHKGETGVEHREVNYILGFAFLRRVFILIFYL